MTPDTLKAWRESHELTQNQLASLLNVTTTTISRWECGQSKIPAFLLLALHHLHRELASTHKTP